MKLADEKILRIKERDIVRVEVREGYIQPFYRSTGKNSGKKGTWFPFDGLLCIMGEALWFIKNQYGSRDASGMPTELHRYGTEELRKVSEFLGKNNIPRGVESTPAEITTWLECGYEV